ncbi:MAG: DUF924 family protein [Acidiferrobacterales bacterium]
MEQIDEVLSFWLGALGDDGLPRENRSRLWFQSNATTDKLIRERFEDDLQKAAVGELVDWEQNAKGRLALIVLLDQFSRNIYRGTPKAFTQDKQARTLCLGGIEQGHDLTLAPIERAFFYLPLAHAESPEMQDKSVALLQALVQSVPHATRRKLQTFLDHAIGHRDIIERFGRFPHRNNILDRPSTPEELAFLNANTSTFGQG